MPWGDKVVRTECMPAKQIDRKYSFCYLGLSKLRVRVERIPPEKTKQKTAKNTKITTKKPPNKQKKQKRRQQRGRDEKAYWNSSVRFHGPGQPRDVRDSVQNENVGPLLQILRISKWQQHGFKLNARPSTCWPCLWAWLGGINLVFQGLKSQ